MGKFYGSSKLTNLKYENMIINFLNFSECGNVKVRSR